MDKTIFFNEHDFNLWKNTIEERYFKKTVAVLGFHFNVEQPKEYPVIAVTDIYESQIDSHCMPFKLCRAILVYPSDFKIVQK